MANPQLDDGHTKIANELMDALMRTNFSPYERRILDCIMRKTYGWNKKTDRISYTQYEESTKIDHRHIGRALFSLKTRRIITVSGTGYKLEYGVQKDYELWIDTRTGTKLTPKKALIVDGNLTPALKNLTPVQGDFAPELALNLTPEVAHTKAIKHYTKAITKARDNFQLPDWIKKDTWDAFLEMRKKKKATPTPRAIELLIRELGKLKLAGNDPNEVLEQSIRSNWTDVYAIKKSEVKGNVTGAYKQRPRQLIPRDQYTDPDSI